MSLNRAAIAAWLIAVAPVPAAIPAHTTFEIRLLTPISSYYSKPGDEVRGVVVEAVCVGSGSFFPPGTVVRGTVKSLHRVGLGIWHETAKVDLQFREAQLADGRTLPIAARLVSVDNARERVDSKGAIRGIRATATLSNRVGERLALATMGHPIALIPILAMETLLLRFPDPEIEYRPGTDLHLVLDSALALPPTAGCVDRIPQLDQSRELQDLVAKLPYWTYTQRQHKAMDPTNLMVIGTEEELNRAFGSAGWSGSRSYSPAADLGVVRAIAEDHADREAPMRTLLLDDQEPDMYRQKALNTFENAITYGCGSGQNMGRRNGLGSLCNLGHLHHLLFPVLVSRIACRKMRTWSVTKLSATLPLPDAWIRSRISSGRKIRPNRDLRAGRRSGPMAGSPSSC